MYILLFVCRRMHTVTNLLQIIFYIFKVFSSGSQADVIYKDFSKAFNRVNH